MARGGHLRTSSPARVPGHEVWIARKLDGNNDPVAWPQVYRYKVEPRMDGSSTTMLRSGGTGLSTAPNVVEYDYIVEVICSQP